MDWTDFDADDQTTLALSLVTNHGRATPLIWLTIDKDELKDQRNDFEDVHLTRLKEAPPEGVAATILADRGFGDIKLFGFLESLGFEYQGHLGLRTGGVVDDEVNRAEGLADGLDPGLLLCRIDHTEPRGKRLPPAAAISATTRSAPAVSLA
jgi:hypothetical protein